MRMFYAVIYTIIWPFFNLVHPHRAIGRERIPEGGVLPAAPLCADLPGYGGTG